MRVDSLNSVELHLHCLVFTEIAASSLCAFCDQHISYSATPIFKWHWIDFRFLNSKSKYFPHLDCLTKEPLSHPTSVISGHGNISLIDIWHSLCNGTSACLPVFGILMALSVSAVTLWPSMDSSVWDYCSRIAVYFGYHLFISYWSK